MENNQEFAIFFSDAPKGKKIGAVLSWIATAILLVALFVPGFRVKFQTQNQNGKYQDIPATETYELNQAKEAWKLNVQLGTNKISGKLNSFLENGKTSVFSYLSDSSLLNAKLMTDENITTDKESGKSPMGWILNDRSFERAFGNCRYPVRCLCNRQLCSSFRGGCRG